MLWLLIPLLHLNDCRVSVAQSAAYEEGRDPDRFSVTARPHIYKCRSPNMEDFTCWWYPLDNLTNAEDVSYILTYSIGKGPIQGCPDYVTAGSNSCHFDKVHTSVWEIYCMNVTAVTAHRNYTSQQHCIDVADVVQTEAPVNLTYKLTDLSEDDSGQSVYLSWQYPVPSHLHYGWITLLFELQYRPISEPGNWKVKHLQQDTHVELFGLAVGDYMVRIRCRSRNYGLWSKWSDMLVMTIPSGPPTGKLLVVVLVSVGVVTLVIFAVGILFQNKRLKVFFLPPVPKPRIQGIDPLLLKKGQLDEINHHFRTFHSYKSQSYMEEIWEKVSVDSFCPTDMTKSSSLVKSTNKKTETLVIKPEAPDHLLAENQTPSERCQLSYCSLPAAGFSLPQPGPDIKMPLNENVIQHSDSTPPPDNNHGTQPEFYTCVQLVKESSQLHLVPYVATVDCKRFSLPLADNSEAGEMEKKLLDCQVLTNVKKLKDSERAEIHLEVTHLLPSAAD